METIILSLLTLVVFISIVQTASAGVQDEYKEGYLWKILTEDVILIRIDSSIAGQYVPRDYELYTDTSSKAHILLVNQNNHKIMFNGKDLRTADDVLHWIRIIKPQDHRYIPGTKVTMKTFSWFEVFFGSSIIQSRKAWRTAGTVDHPIIKVNLNRKGKIKSGETLLSDKKKYHWQYKLKEPRTRFVGVNHDLYYKTSAGNNKMHQIKAAVEVSGWGSEAELTIIGSDKETGYLPEGRYNANVNSFLNVWVTVTLGKET